jgi:mannose-6-phosphate isomerase
MGVHPNAPSTVPSENDRLLSEYMSEHRGSLGTLTSLPFLFKVMAIEKPLSIQCHPSKEQLVAGCYAAEADRRTKVRRHYGITRTTTKKRRCCAP